MSEINENKCPNCGSFNPDGFKYCLHCGQKNRPLKVTFFEFVSDFFSLVFNIENKFFKTLQLIFVPGRLTKLFFQGKRKSFYHPLRLYLVSVLIFFGVLSIMKIDQLIQIDGDGTFNLKDRYSMRLKVVDQKSYLNNTIDSLKKQYTDPAQSALLDSLPKELFVVAFGDTIYLNEADEIDSTGFSLLSQKVSLTRSEMLTENIDSLIERKQINNMIDRIAFRQVLKGSRDLGSFNKFIFANLTWLFLAIIPVFSLILKLFYIRRKRYYMEHFVFLLHLFTGLIFFTSIFILIASLVGRERTIGAILGGIVMFFPLLAFKYYYKQGWFKTFIKYLAIGLFFSIAFILVFSIFLFVTAALF